MNSAAKVSGMAVFFHAPRPSEPASYAFARGFAGAGNTMAAVTEYFGVSGVDGLSKVTGTSAAPPWRPPPRRGWVLSS